MRSLLPVLILLTCVSVSAQEVLLVDKWLQDPIAFKPFFEDFPKNGLELKYRRFHPSLTHSDADRFDAIMVAGGMHPDHPAPTYLIPEEAALLTAFVRNGGTAVFMFADHSTDNYIFNTILDSLGVKVRIEGTRIEDPLGPKATIIPATHYLNLAQVFVSSETPLGEGIEGPIAGGRMFSIMVGQTEGIEIPAWTAPSSMRRRDDVNTPQRGREGTYAGQARSYAAVVTAAAGKGHVILLPRYLINLNGYTGLATDKPVNRPYFLEPNRRFEKNLVSYIAAIARGEYEPQELMTLSRLDNLDGPNGLPEPDFRFRKRALDEDAHEQDYDDLQAFDDIPPHQPAFLGDQT